MISRKTLAAFLSVWLAAGASAVSAGDLGDAEVDQKRDSIDTKLVNRLARVKQDLDKLNAFLVGVAKERQDFERHMAEEHKGYMDYLKKVTQADRKKQIDHFYDKQEGEREDFDKRQLKGFKAWFKDSIEKNWKSRSLELESVAAEAAPQAAEVAPAEAASAAPVAQVEPSASASAPAAASAPKDKPHAYVYKSKKNRKLNERRKAAEKAEAEPAKKPDAASMDPSPSAPPPPPPGK